VHFQLVALLVATAVAIYMSGGVSKAAGAALQRAQAIASRDLTEGENIEFKVSVRPSRCSSDYKDLQGRRD
jgi:hypothetical protein